MKWDYGLDEGTDVEVELVPLPDDVLSSLKESLRGDDVTNMSEILGGFAVL